MLPQFTLVLGGAASGKSDFAESLARDWHPARLYVATAEAGDAEMQAKVAAHKARRGQGWDLREEPLELARVLEQVPPGRVVLVDCATMWLANLQASRQPAGPALTRLIQAIQACKAPVIMVSNELGQGVVPANAAARAFRQAHGEMNRHLAHEAGLVVMVVAGLPMVLKGALPVAGG